MITIIAAKLLVINSKINMKYYIFQSTDNIPLLAHADIKNEALCPTRAELEFWDRIQELEKENNRLKSQLINNAFMPRQS